MQEVLIDITRLVKRFIRNRLPTGIDRVALAYVRQYGSNARAVLRVGGWQCVFRRAESEDLFSWVLALGQSASPLRTLFKGFAAALLEKSTKGCFLFNVGHSGLESDAYINMLERKQLKPIFMVHDLIPITHPQYCRAGEQSKHLRRMHNAVRSASGIVCNSQATLHDLQRLCEERGWVMPPTVVALLAPEPLMANRVAAPEGQPYFVYVSTIEPRKNHQMLLQAWIKLAHQLGDAAPRLVLIGQTGWDYNDVMDLLASSNVLKRLVTHISDCSDADMVGTLNGARALLFPSFTEGFGMPLVEALALGLPVIASDLPVFREFAGNIPDYIDVADENRWIQTIASYCKPNSQRRSDQLARVAGFVAPGWPAHFAKVDSFLNELAMKRARDE